MRGGGGVLAEMEVFSPLFLLPRSPFTHPAWRRQREPVRAACRGTWAIKSSYTVGRGGGGGPRAQDPQLMPAPRAEVLRRREGKVLDSGTEWVTTYLLLYYYSVDQVIKWLQLIQKCVAWVLTRTDQFTLDRLPSGSQSRSEQLNIILNP